MAVTPASEGGNTSSAEPSGVSRRSVARGVAWATPAVVIGAAAPAQAASPTPVLAGSVFVGRNYYGRGEVTFMSATAIPPSPAASICVNQTTVNTAITNVSVTVWLAASTLTFTTSTGSSACWSAPTRNTGLANKTFNGYTYYAYTTKYTCAIAATSGNTCLPAFNFTDASGSNKLPAISMGSDYFYKNVQATVNGTVQNVNTGPNPLS